MPVPPTAVIAEATDSGAQTAEKHCGHCGRAVRETVHRRASYVVDCFVLHTGETEQAIVRRPESDEVALVYRRLVRPIVVITCADCYADFACRRRHQSWSYPAD